MAATVELNVRSRLAQIADDLKSIAEAGNEAQENLKNFGKDLGETHSQSMRRTERHLGQLRNVGARVFETMKQDFKAMLSAVGISEGLKLGSAFRDSIKETFELSDTIRKLGSVFGITQDRFAGFQDRITKGLGEIGLGATETISALRGLSETQVRGEEELIEYSRAAGMLAAATGTKGQEGRIAQGMARTLTAQGRDPNDIVAMRKLSEDLRKAYNATGQIPSAILQALESVIASMPTDLRKTISTTGLVQLGTVAATAGPNATQFLQEFLGKSPVARKALEARGFAGVFGAEGFDVERFREAAGGVMQAFPGDPRLMAQTLGLSEDAAEGFVRLYESLDRVAAAQAKMESDTGRLEDQYRSAMGAAEAFRASLNKVKAAFAKPLSITTDVVTEGLKSASETQLGATATVAGAGLLASMLAGGGIRGLLNLGRGKAVGTAERLAYETTTGRSVSDVYVVNATEIGQAAGSSTETMGMLAKFGGAIGMLAKAGLVGAAGAGGYAVGSLLNEQIKGTELDAAIDRFLAPAFTALTGGGVEQPTPTSVTAPPGGTQPDVLGRVPQIVTQGGDREAIRPVTPETRQRPQSPDFGPQKPQRMDLRVDVNVSTKQKDLKATARPSRGGSQ